MIQANLQALQHQSIIVFTGAGIAIRKANLPAGDCCLIPPVQLETNKNGMLFDRVLCLICGSLNEFAIV